MRSERKNVFHLTSKNATLFVMFYSESSAIITEYTYTTLLQRQILRQYHMELEQKGCDSERDLRIKFNNGLPKIIYVKSKK